MTHWLEARVAELEAQVAALTQERDMLKREAIKYADLYEDEYAKRLGAIRPPLALNESVFDVTYGFETDAEGRITPTRYVRACEGAIHVYAAVPGECQCGQNFWDGNNTEPA